MTNSYKDQRKHGRLLFAFFVVLCACALLPTAAIAQDSTYLASFMDRQDGCSDYLYVSFDGKTFEHLGVAYQDTNGKGLIDSGTPYEVYTLHDPAIGYHDGAFWMMSGFTWNVDGGWKFYPMFGSSRDLVNWTFPNKPTGVPGTVAGAVDTNGKLSGGAFDCAGPDFMFDDNGDCWVVVPLGYYGDFHGEAQKDYMLPYITKITGLARHPENDQNVSWARGALPLGSSGDFTRINLPVAGTNWIDPSLYKENGKYYLSIKKDGVQNYIFEIDDLSNASNAKAWRVVNQNVVTGYEGPCLTKSNDNKYFFYTDKLVDFQDANGIGVTGIYYQSSDAMSSGWSWPQPINTIDALWNKLPSRHGSVTRIDDPTAKQVILNLRSKLGYTSFTDVRKLGDNPTAHVDDIEWLAAQGISKGWDDHTFRPMSNVARCDMAAFLFRLARNWGIVDDTWQPSGAKEFTDVDASTPHYREVMWLAEEGISTGWKYSDGTAEFRPFGDVARCDMAAFLYRLAGKAGINLTPRKSFPDEGPDHTEEIRWLAAMGISTGYPDGTFRPLNNVVRQDMAAFLQRLSDLAEQSASIDEGEV